MVRKRGLEPPRPCGRQPLKLVRLPIPPLPRGVDRTFRIAGRRPDVPTVALNWELAFWELGADGDSSYRIVNITAAPPTVGVIPTSNFSPARPTVTVRPAAMPSVAPIRTSLR